MKTIAPLVDGIVNNALFHSKARLKTITSCAFSPRDVSRYTYKSNISKTVRFRDKVIKDH